MGEPREDKSSERGATLENENTDYKLLLETLSKRVMGGCQPAEVEELLARKEAWQSLGPQDALRWSGLAQIAGLPDVSLEILEWLTENHPQLESGWVERLELLRTLEIRDGLVRARAQAISVLGEERVKALLAQSTAEVPDAQTSQPAGERTESWHEDDDIGDPFVEMRKEEEAIRLYMDLFRGREDVFARQWYDEESDAQGYVPVRRPMLAADVRDHLKGGRTYGIYLLDPQSQTRLGVIDIDIVPTYRGRKLAREEQEKLAREERYLLERLVELSEGASMHCLVEFTGGKGYHFWYPIEEAVPAARVRSALRALAVKVEGDVTCYQLEIFPKQDSLVGGKGLGNLVKLPLGIHRGTGKPSFFLMAPDRSTESQLTYLRQVRRVSPSALETVASSQEKAKLFVHPRYEAWAQEYPELAVLEAKCSVIAQILASCRSSRTLSVREEKVLLGTVGHLPQARKTLHHALEQLPEYNRPLLDYKISRIRGTPLGCRRIHRLLGDADPTPLCRFEGVESAYWNPLLHVEDGQSYTSVPKSEGVENLEDALEALNVSIRQVRRFLQPGRR